MRQYNDLKSKSEDLFTDPIKMSMLQNAVSEVTDLRSVRVTAETLAYQTQDEVTYDMYCTLLNSAAQSYDKQHSGKGLTVVDVNNGKYVKQK